MSSTEETVSLSPQSGEVSSYATAMEACSSGSEPEMVFAMEEASRQGDLRASYALATWYLHGTYGYPEAPEAAIPLLQEAASGIREAMFDLAVSFDSGIGVGEDPREAYLWYLRAALRGEPQAISIVASYTAHGRGVQVDLRAALAWYEVAEQLGVDVDEAGAFRDWLQEHNEE